MESRRTGWRRALTRPGDDAEIFDWDSAGLRPRLTRLYGAISFLNACLLAPMLTLIVAEVVVGQQVHKLLHDEALMVGFCGSFALEWLIGLLIARSKWRYLTNVWLGLDLLSSVPFGFLFQAGRLARLGRVGRFFRFAGYAKAAKLLRLQRMRLDTLRFVRAAAILLSVAASGAIAIRSAEPSTATTFTDAFWWSLVTISTVGYGDIYPHSFSGRMVGIVLIVFGIGVYGYVAGLTTDAVTHPEDAREHQETLAAIGRLEQKLEALSQSIDEIRSR